MSHNSVKRPLRLLSGYEEIDARPPRANAIDETEYSAEWFRRILLGGRDSKPDASEPRLAKTLGRDTAKSSPEAPPSRGGEGASMAIHAPAPTIANRTVHERPPATGEEAAPQRRPAQPSAPRQPGIPDRQAQEHWADHMASLVDQLCSRADPAFKSWTATLRMDPNVLPDTQLRLSLSPHWLSLRFVTESAAATRLVSGHRTELQTLLERAPNLPHGIDIDIA